MVQWLKHSGTRQRVVTYTYPNRTDTKFDNFNFGNDDYDDNEEE